MIFAVFFVQGAWPVPDVNEPYYLGKAIHFWNPDWVEGDFFLNSADAHWAFYFAFGWLSLVMSPPVLAWAGRVLTWGLLAWSWHRLSWALVPRRGMALLSGALFACLMERCHMAGEWVIGGVEAKGFAYVLVFLGLEAMVRDRWNRAWLLWGAASLLHVVVGGWVVVAAGLRGSPPAGVGRRCGRCGRAFWAAWRSRSRRSSRCWRSTGAWTPRPPPGHIGSTSTTACRTISFCPNSAGTSCCVSECWWRCGRCSAWRSRETVGRLFKSSHTAKGRLRGFVFGSLVIALAGAALSVLMYVAPAWGARLLRFYWFRLSDVAVPMGVALFAVLLIDRWLASRPVLGRPALALAAIVVVLHVGDFTRLRGACVGAAARRPPRGPQGG